MCIRDSNSLLLLTRVDKLTSERDRRKVIRRVRAETEGLFLECLPISLLQATTEQDDYEVWYRSGAGEFAKHFAALLQGLSPAIEAIDRDAKPVPTKPLRMPAFEGPEKPVEQEPAFENTPPRITPRRVRLRHR